MQRLTLYILGPIRLLETSGEELEIKSVKARALLAILAVSSGNRCQRSQLTELLWSKGKSRESLRQDLRKLRRIAGADLFSGGNGWIGLNPEIVTVDTSPPHGDGWTDSFGSDLGTIHEPAFEDWLRDCRQRFASSHVAPTDSATERTQPARPATRHSPSNTVRITIVPSDCAEAQHRIYADMLLQDAAQRAAPLIQAELVTAHDQAAFGPNGGLVLNCRASGSYGRVILQPQITNAADGTVVWSQFFAAPDSLLSKMLADAVAATTVALVSTGNVIQCGTHPEVTRRETSAIPFSDIFSFNRDRMRRADERLAVLQGSSRNGGILALRALLRHNQTIERFVDDPDDCLDEANRLARHAIEMSPHDPLAIAIASLTCGLVQSETMALELAERAKRVDPDHAFVRQSLSVALSFTGHAAAAHAEATAARSNRMAMLAPALFYIRNAKTALGIGDHGAALRWAVLAIETSPEFRAAHRAVAALAYHAGQEETALKSLEALKALEPDFSLDRMASDDYPVFTLRAAGLLSVTRSGLI